MREIALIGCDRRVGTTTLTLALAQLQQPLVLADCDCDRPDLDLLLPGHGEDARRDFFADKLPAINFARCDNCGLCYQSCNREAILMIGQYPDINPAACDSCQVCGLVCPTGAITFRPQEFGTWFQREIDLGALLFARRGFCQENGGRLSAKLRSEGVQLAHERNLDLVLMKGPPGIHFHMHPILDQLDCAVLVATPDKYGKQRLDMQIDLCLDMNVPVAVLINRSGIETTLAMKLEEHCREAGAILAAQLPNVPALLDPEPPRPEEIPELVTALESFWAQLLELTATEAPRT